MVSARSALAPGPGWSQDCAAGPWHPAVASLPPLGSGWLATRGRSLLCDSKGLLAGWRHAEPEPSASLLPNPTGRCHTQMSSIWTPPISAPLGGQVEALPNLDKAVHHLGPLLPTVLRNEPVLVKGIAKVLCPLHPEERPPAQLERLWSLQTTAPWPHYLDGLYFTPAWVLVSAELNVVFWTK